MEDEVHSFLCLRTSRDREGNDEEMKEEKRETSEQVYFDVERLGDFFRLRCFSIPYTLAQLVTLIRQRCKKSFYVFRLTNLLRFRRKLYATTRGCNYTSLPTNTNRNLNVS